MKQREGESATLVLLNHFPLFIIDKLDNPAYTLRFRVYGFRSAHMDADHCNNRHSAPSCIGLCLYHNRARSGTCFQSEMKSLKTSFSSKSWNIISTPRLDGLERSKYGFIPTYQTVISAQVVLFAFVGVGQVTSMGAAASWRCVGGAQSRTAAQGCRTRRD